MKSIAIGICISGIVLLAFTGQSDSREPAGIRSDFQSQVRDLIDRGRADEARKLLRTALDHPSKHFSAYGTLMQMAIEAGDSDEVAALVRMHEEYPFAAPAKFSTRVQYYDAPVLQRIHDQAVQSALKKDWPEAEHGFSQLLGDGLFHEEAVKWLFRLAMRRHQFERAEFVSGLAHHHFPDRSRSADLLTACVLQRKGHRQPALGHVIRLLGSGGAYHGDGRKRVRTQRAVFLAMIRLHNGLDQCFLHQLKSPAQARPVFPDLPDRVLKYLAR